MSSARTRNEALSIYKQRAGLIRSSGAKKLGGGVKL